MDGSQHDLTLVIGGTGRTGRRVAERLTRVERPVRIGSRSAALPFDWEDRSTWKPALQGCAAAYISYYPDLAAPGAPESIGAFSEATIARATRRAIGYTRVPADAFAAAMATHGVPKETTELITYLFTTVLDGRNAYVADGVQRALDRPARDFADYARAVATTGVWTG